MLPHTLHILAQSISEQITPANISVGLLVLIEMQVANLQVKVYALTRRMRGKKK